MELIMNAYLNNYSIYYNKENHLIIELPVDGTEENNDDQMIFELPADIEEAEEERQEATTTPSPQNPATERAHKIAKHTLSAIDNGFELTSKALEILSQKELQQSVDTVHLFVKTAIGIHCILQGKFSLDLTRYFNSVGNSDEITVAKSWLSAITFAGTASKSAELISQAASLEKISEVFEKGVSPFIGKICKDPALLMSNIASLEQARLLPETTEEERYIREISIAKYQLKVAVKGLKVAGTAVVATGAVMASSAVTIPLAILGFGIGAVDAYLTYQDIKKDFFQ